MDQLSCNNHKEKKDQEIEGMRVNKNVIHTSVNIPVYTSIQDIQAATHEDAHL